MHKMYSKTNKWVSSAVADLRRHPLPQIVKFHVTCYVYLTKKKWTIKQATLFAFLERSKTIYLIYCYFYSNNLYYQILEILSILLHFRWQKYLKMDSWNTYFNAYKISKTKELPGVSPLVPSRASPWGPLGSPRRPPDPLPHIQSRIPPNLNS
jgi:hypothetical protein